jgi:hypothetical protein
VKPGELAHTRCDRATQVARREAERTVRKRVLAFARVVRFTGRTLPQASALLGLKDNTLRDWRYKWADDGLPVRKVGRPRADLPPDVYEVIVALFTIAGGGIMGMALRFLFAEHGTPLVLKTDNEFDADELIAFLGQNRVTQLLSPPEFPRYNGAIEAGIGSLKTHIYYEAAVHGHPEEWSSNDVEAGRLRANELARPNGFQGASPGQRFDSRSPISEEERAAFEAAVQKSEAAVLAKRGLLPFAPLERREYNAVRRTAIALALVDRSILQISIPRAGKNHADS